MKRFLKKTILFLLIPLAVMGIGLLLPPTPLAKEYILCAKPMKDSLLANAKPPRIIFIAGSSMNFGLNSQVMKDSLHRNPIDIGTHGATGLYFMMDQTVPYIQKGDIIVVVAEYHQFYGDFADGGEELLRVLFDNNDGMDFFKLRWRQIEKTYPHIPKYALSKFMPGQYFKKKMDPVYNKTTFNRYGDATAHWTIPYAKKVDPFTSIVGGDFAHGLVDALAEFNQIVKSKGATLYLSYPPYQKTSYDNCKPQIDYLIGELHKHDFTIISKPEEYIVGDDMLYDTPYHLNKKGVDFRTQHLMQDIKAQLQKEGK